ncbi:LysM peptidoglycan-binding domain-containing protein [Microbacterium koreense]
MRRRGALAVQTAVAGSVALTLSAAPALAAEPTARERESRQLDVAFADLRAAVSQAMTAHAAAPTHYTVVAGDTVSTIAARFGVRTADVLALNGLTWSATIYPGQTLLLRGSATGPTEVTSPTTHTVVAGESPFSIAQRHGVTTDDLLDANALTRDSLIHPGQQLTVPGAPVRASTAAPAPSASASHTVTAGDTVSAIAQRHGITTDAVLAANGLSRSSIIYPGQTLTIPTSSTSRASTASIAGLDSEQIANARIIIQVGRELGVSDRGIAIALGTAMQESWIRNLDWGDRDSLGLFQQRPSTGWGTAAQIRDPYRSTRVFFGGSSDPNGTATRGLLDIPGWQSMSFAEAAQAVQISAYPDRYARWEQPAYAWLAALG